jgi:hypothetical protein
MRRACVARDARCARTFPGAARGHRHDRAATYDFSFLSASSIPAGTSIPSVRLSLSPSS